MDLPPEALRVIGAYVLDRLGTALWNEPPELEERQGATRTLGAFMLTSKACYAAIQELEELAGRMLRASFLEKELENLTDVIEHALSGLNGCLQMTYQRLIFFAAPGSKKCPSVSIYTDSSEHVPARIISIELLKPRQQRCSHSEADLADLCAVTFEPLTLASPPTAEFAYDSSDSYSVHYGGGRRSVSFDTIIEYDQYSIPSGQGGGRGYRLPKCMHDVLAPDAITIGGSGPGAWWEAVGKVKFCG